MLPIGLTTDNTTDDNQCKLETLSEEGEDGRMKEQQPTILRWKGVKVCLILYGSV